MDIQLPTQEFFGLPRYPNMWVFVSRDLAPSYERAVHFVIKTHADYLGVKADAGHAHDRLHCDARATIRNLQPYRGYANHRRNHSHALDIRYYFRQLRAHEMEHYSLELHGQQHDFWRVAAQVRYEPSSVHNPPEDCPICGKYGEYCDVDGDVNALVRDPLGLELSLYGTVRGKPVAHPNGSLIRGIRSMASDYELYFGVLDADSLDVNTPRVGCVALLDKAETWQNEAGDDASADQWAVGH